METIGVEKLIPTPTAEPTPTPTSESTSTPTLEPTATPTPTLESADEPDVKCIITVNEEPAEVSKAISNTYEDDKKVVIAVAQYDEGILVNIMLNEITVQAKTSEQYTVKADYI